MSRQPWESERPTADLLSLLQGVQPQRAPWGPSRSLSRQPGAHPQARGPGSDRSLSEAVGEFLAAHSILDLLGAAVDEGAFRRVASTWGGEFAGPCPLCGGRDRLRVWPSPKDGAPRAWCRQCLAAGDALAWATMLAGRDPAQRGATAQTLREHGLLRAPTVARSRHVGGDPLSKLSKSAPTEPWPVWAVEAFEERAAIMEFDGGLSRSEAERRARTSVQLLIVTGGASR